MLMSGLTMILQRWKKISRKLRSQTLVRMRRGNELMTGGDILKYETLIRIFF